LTDETTQATRRALEQLRISDCELELIDQAGVAPFTFEELVDIVRVDLGASSVLPLTPQDIAPPDPAPPRLPEPGVSALVEVISVGSPSHRPVRQVHLTAGRSVQIFFRLDVLPTTTRLQIELHATWPAVVTFDTVAVLNAAEIVDIDPMEFEQHLAFYNCVPLGLDDRGFTLLCTGGTMVVQLLESIVTRQPRARMLELRLRCRPFEAPFGERGGLRAIGHPEDRLLAAASHLAARTARLEDAFA
jgi:hypothetical protein